MKIASTLGILTIIALTACGSGGSDIPNIAGTYDCSTSCTGTCDFPTTLTITQNEENIIIESDTGNQVGTVDENGIIETSTDNGNCSGQIVQGTAILDCEFDGEDCQQVTFKHQ